MANDANLRPWVPGQSGNPNGYSRGRRAIDDLLDLIHEKGQERAVSEVWLQSLLAGDFRFFKEYLDRKDGQPDQAPEKIDLEFVASVMRERRAKLDGGLPGGSTPSLP
jgi:hypothetical protein